MTLGANHKENKRTRLHVQCTKAYLRINKRRHFARMLTATCSTYIEAGASRMQAVQLRRRHSARLPAGGAEVVIGRRRVPATRPIAPIFALLRTGEPRQLMLTERSCRDR